MKIGAYLGLVVLGALASSLMACTPGYMKASELDRNEQGPSFCDARCHELGMRMGALVLVSNELPGCVCQPLGNPKDGNPKDAADAPTEGASAATGGEVVIAAAAAAQRQQQQQQQQQQQNHQSYKSH